MHAGTFSLTRAKMHPSSLSHPIFLSFKHANPLGLSHANTCTNAHNLTNSLSLSDTDSHSFTLIISVTKFFWSLAIFFCLVIYLTRPYELSVYLHLLFLFSNVTEMISLFLSQVMSVKALGIGLKLTFSGMNQLIYPETWVFTLIVGICVVTQMNYLNKVFTIMPSNKSLTLLHCIMNCHVFLVSGARHI